MRHKLKFAELQTPLFLEGTNLSVKLNTTLRDVSLFWDDETDKLLVWFKNKVALVPMGNVASMTPIDVTPFLHEETQQAAAQLKPVQAPAPRGRPPTKIKAQVSTPTSHVFDGPNEKL